MNKYNFEILGEVRGQRLQYFPQVYTIKKYSKWSHSSNNAKNPTLARAPELVRNFSWKLHTKSISVCQVSIQKCWKMSEIIKKLLTKSLGTQLQQGRIKIVAQTYIVMIMCEEDYTRCVVAWF